jgi:hypothetical protein
MANLEKPPLFYQSLNYKWLGISGTTEKVRNSRILRVENNEQSLVFRALLHYPHGSDTLLEQKAEDY